MNFRFDSLTLKIITVICNLISFHCDISFPRCPARVRAYKKSGKLDMININHNHPIGIQPQKWRSARKKS